MPTSAPPGGRSFGWKIRFKVILIDWGSFDDILMHFTDQIRKKTWWVNARKMLIRKDSTEYQSVWAADPSCLQLLPTPKFQILAQLFTTHPPRIVIIIVCLFVTETTLKSVTTGSERGS